MFEEVIDRAADTHRLLADDLAFEVFAPRLSTLVFRFVAAGVADERLDEINREIRKAIFPLRRGGHCRHRGQVGSTSSSPCSTGNHAGRPARHRRADS